MRQTVFPFPGNAIQVFGLVGPDNGNYSIQLDENKVIIATILTPFVMPKLIFLAAILQRTSSFRSTCVAILSGGPRFIPEPPTNYHQRYRRSPLDRGFAEYHTIVS